jgi:predicted nucleotidyltransferase
MEEKLIRQVTEIGNGAHIFAPKEWLGEEVVIIRTPKKDPKEEVLKVLYPYLDKIIAVFLFGSYARNEQEKGSDMDIFVISNEKFKVKSNNLDLIIIPEDKIELAKKINPILFYSMLNEARQIINPSYLEKLKQEKVNFGYFKEFIEDTKKSIDSNREIIEMDKKLKNKEVSESVIYSLILRLRGVFIINLLLSNKIYSKKIFKEWIIKNSRIDYGLAYSIYQAVRDNKKPDKKILMGQGESLLSLLIKETENLSKKIK